MKPSSHAPVTAEFLPCSRLLPARGIFPIRDAEYESQLIRDVRLAPIPSFWGHAGGAGFDPADAKFIDEAIRGFLR